MHMPQALSPRRAVLLVALPALLIAGALAVNNSAGATPIARLALIKRSPVTVSGHGFRAHRRVTVLLVADGTVSRRPLTNGSGAFMISFPAVINPCTGWSVTAIQPGRAPVILRNLAKPDCAPLGTS